MELTDALINSYEDFAKHHGEPKEVIIRSDIYNVLLVEFRRFFDYIGQFKDYEPTHFKCAKIVVTDDVDAIDYVFKKTSTKIDTTHTTADLKFKDMSLRDYIAIKAMAPFITIGYDTDADMGETCRDIYRFADAMIKEGNK